MIKLGLIGQSIAKSRAPSLHIMLGEIYGIDVSYELHEPRDASAEAFAETLGQMRVAGYSGTNVTFPYKQLAVAYADNVNEAVRLVGSTNTLSLLAEISAANTDYTGFIRGYRSRRGETAAGRVLILGAGGVGRAVAFGLFEVGASEVMVFDLDEKGATVLCDALNAAGKRARPVRNEDLADAARMADGLVNCTPVGHYKTPGNPLAAELFGGQSWAFDAVYTPMDTEFLQAAHGKGLQLVSGFDLFIYQGLDAFEIFTQRQVDPTLAIQRFKEKFEIHSDLVD